MNNFILKTIIKSIIKIFLQLKSSTKSLKHTNTDKEKYKTEKQKKPRIKWSPNWVWVQHEQNETKCPMHAFNCFKVRSSKSRICFNYQ